MLGIQKKKDECAMYEHAMYKEAILNIILWSIWRRVEKSGHGLKERSKWKEANNKGMRFSKRCCRHREGLSEWVSKWVSESVSKWKNCNLNITDRPLINICDGCLQAFVITKMAYDVLYKTLTWEDMGVDFLLGCEWLQKTNLAFSMSYLWFDRIIKYCTAELKVHS